MPLIRMMNRISPFLTMLMIATACGQNTSIISNSASFNAAYQAPAFVDSERIKKVELTLPVIESIYKDYAEKNHFPGLAFGVVVDGKLLLSGSAGYTDVAQKIAATTKPLFRIASMTKSITAMAILKLRDDGKLRLDDPVSVYIPELLNMPGLTTEGPAITIRHLMTHTAGFPEDNPWGDRQLEDTDADLIELIKDGISLSNAPGIAFEYSNLGFAILGLVITRVSGEPYQQYITENILKPLGMESTSWEYADVPKELLAHGYRWLREQWSEEPILHDGSYGAMGGLITSLEDFSKYVALHLSAWPPGSANANIPLRMSSLREMHQPWAFVGTNPRFKYPGGRACALVSSYSFGLGWTKDCEGRVLVGHGGGLPGFGSQWRILPAYGIGIIAFANVTYANLSTANWAVLDTIIAMAELRPRQSAASMILEQRKNELLQLFPGWEKADNTNIFAENFFKDYSIDSLRTTCGNLYVKAQGIQRVRELIPENQLRGTFMIEGEKTDIEVFFTLTPENPPLIQELRIKESVRRRPE